jgi:type IV secretory pathway TraG/TraD family ATPase VirD4
MTGLLYGLTHGTAGLAVALATVEASLLAGLLRSRASAPRLLASPLLAVPMTVLAGGATAGLHPVLAAAGMAAGWGQLAVGAAVSAGIAYACGRALGRERSEPEWRRGAQVVSAAQLEQARTPVRVPQRHAGRRADLQIAGMSLPESDETKHFKFIGTTGTGKSSAITGLVGAALARGDRAIIADPDGGYLRRFYDPQRGDLIFNPFDTRSVKWDLFGELRSTPDVGHLARALIPDGEGSERAWRGYARTFFSAVTSQTHAAGVRDARELFRLLVVADSRELRELVRYTPAQPFLEEHNSRMFDSIRSVTSSAIGALEHVAEHAGPLQSVRDWVDSGRGVLFLPYRGSQIATLGPVISAWMRLAIFQSMEQPEGDQRLWFVVDELDALGPIDGLKDALARLRKFGGRCVLGFQSIAQVAATYGAGDAHTIVENCGNSLILRCSASEGGGTARFACALIGDREVVHVLQSRSRRLGEWRGARTHSEQLHTEPAVMAAQIEQLPDLTGYLKLASHPAWALVRLSPPVSRRGPASALTPQSASSSARLDKGLEL